MICAALPLGFVDAAPESSPVKFAAHGRQYVVVAPSAGVTLVVFELP